MTVKDILKQKKNEFDDIFDFYLTDIGGLRTGRANPGLVEDIKVNVYGSEQKIKELASISTADPRTLAIQPWDKGAVGAISNAINASKLGLNPVVDGNIIRVIIPPLTEERRKELTKTLKQRTEDARIKVRRAREEIWNKIQSMEKNGEIREDDKFKGKEDLQKMVDELNKKIEDSEKKKEGELMTV